MQVARMLIVALALTLGCDGQTPQQAPTQTSVAEPPSPAPTIQAEATATDEVAAVEPDVIEDSVTATQDAGPEELPVSETLPEPDPELTEVGSIPEDTRIYVRIDGHCRNCTNYSVAISANGKAELRRGVAESAGKFAAAAQDKTVSKKELKTLLKEFGQIGFLDADERVIEHCQLRPHGSETSLALTFDGRTKYLKWPKGCRRDHPLPAALETLADSVLSTAGMREFLSEAGQGKHLVEEEGGVVEVLD